MRPGSWAQQRAVVPDSKRRLPVGLETTGTAATLRRVRQRANRLIDEIEREALDNSVPISSALRKLVALGGQAGSKELRDWAGLELRGYYGRDVPLPEYRKPPATIRIDGATFNSMITGQMISPSALPDPVNKHIDEYVPLNGGVAEIEGMIASAKKTGGEVKLALPMGQDVVRIMNYEMQQSGQRDQVTAVYWSVSHVTLEGVIDQIRTRLVELVAEMRSEMPDETDVPSAAVADNAVKLVVHGKKPKITVNTAQASGNGNTATATMTPAHQRSAWVKVGGFIVGVAGVVAAATGVALWLGWTPF